LKAKNITINPAINKINKKVVGNTRVNSTFLKNRMKPIFYRPVQLRGLAFLVLLLLALAILGSMIWRNLERFETVLSYVNYSHRIQNVSVGLQQSLI
jgi:hypothetical protein